ncbi:molecular chaperone GroES [Platysternon megacephalum]|uniref:Molecular chaperone GroES n=1 Tax=Platysternon megacephalum TaxID=55544 RepID=A0A4D9DKT7_9SAUR|nr:molecular chaperone GroES [Platysternon megacephalum]
MENVSPKMGQDAAGPRLLLQHHGRLVCQGFYLLQQPGLRARVSNESAFALPKATADVAHCRLQEKGVRRAASPHSFGWCSFVLPSFSGPVTQAAPPGCSVSRA